MLFCLVLALFGCEKVGEEEKEPEQQWGEYPVMEQSLSTFFQYKMADPSGFGRHPLIDKLSDSTQVVIKEGLVLMYNPNQNSGAWGIRVLYLPDLEEEAERLSKEIMEHGSTISLAIYEDGGNNDWLAGEKNGKGWIGKADRKTRKVTNEWTDGKAVEQDIKVDLGYGNYKTVHIDRMLVKNMVKKDNDYIVATTAFNYRDVMQNTGGTEVWYNLYVLSDDKAITIPMKHLARDLYFNSCTIIPWYKNSFLVSQPSPNYDCYSLEGKLIDSFKDVYFSGTQFPCSYTDYINSRGHGWFTRNNLKSNSYPTWSTTYKPLSDMPSDSKETYTLLSSSTNIWEFKVDVLNFDGSKKSFIFKINIDNGEITD